MRLLAELHGMDRRVRDLREGLTELLERASPDVKHRHGDRPRGRA
jgi:hypothetical protein